MIMAVEMIDCIGFRFISASEKVRGLLKVSAAEYQNRDSQKNNYIDQGVN